MDETNPGTELFKRNKISYAALLTISIVFIILAAITGMTENFVLPIPTLAFSIYALQRKHSMSLPPLFVVIVTAVFTLLQLANYFENEEVLISAIADFLLGVFTCLLGLLMVLAMTRSSPNFDLEKPKFVSFSASCIAMTLTLGMFVLEFILTYYTDGPAEIIGTDYVRELIVNAIGIAFLATLFYANRHNGLFKHTLDKFLHDNADSLDIESRERNLILKEISNGESSKLEFKSTLRTNLHTGEKDPRMERAVMKTIVAFLNSRGGTLLIGVADDGTILGVDLDTFEGSRDKFGLHLNHLLTTQIGSEFLPFINYYMADIDGKPVMRVVCERSDRPVFLTDGKEQIFYARSGPSTIDLHGMDLLYYANHNFSKSLRRNN